MAKENKLEKKHSFSQNEISAADFSSVDEWREEKKENRFSLNVKCFHTMK